MFEIISMIGLGYIGLPTATMFASHKKKVIGVDINQNAVDTINQGKIHIVEPELDVLVHVAVKEGYLKAVTIPEPADVFLIAVHNEPRGLVGTVAVNNPTELNAVLFAFNHLALIGHNTD